MEDKIDYPGSNPLFSVVVPTHRRPLLLSRCLESIKTGSLGIRHEVIVVSDEQDPETARICDRWLEGSDTFIRRSGPPGPALSRNMALQLAKGQYLLFLDDDDAWRPGLLSALSQYSDALQSAICYMNCEVVYEQRLASGPHRLRSLELDNENQLNALVYVRNQVHMSCFVFPSFLAKQGMFDPYLKSYEDWDYLLQVLPLSDITHLPLIGTIVHQVPDDTSDRRGNESTARGIKGALDYLYIYRKHGNEDPHIKSLRRALLSRYGLELPNDVL